MKPLNPIMAVLVIASVGASPLQTLAADGNRPVGVIVAAEDTGTIGAMTRIMKDNAEARKDAGLRISQFLLEEFVLKSDPKKATRSFVRTEVDPKGREVLGTVAKEWGASLGTPEDVAVLYFVIGPGAEAPKWAPKAFQPGMQWLGKLRFLLSDPGKGDWTGKAQISSTKDKEQLTAFLNAAVQASWSALDPRTKAEVDLSVDGNNTTDPGVPNTTRGAGTRLDAMNQYGFNELYMDGAVVREVAGPNDPNSRRISMKVYTKRMPDGSTVNEIGIFDITDKHDIFGQRFPLTGGNQSFILDDRTPGHKKYELKFETLPNGERKVVFARPGDGGTALETTVSDLYTKRADQAAAMGNIVSVGGEDFYVLPQGGAKGALAFFPKTVIDARTSPGADPRNLVPKLYAEVGKRGADGRIENIPGKPHLGGVGDKEFHLEFNKTLGVWEVKDGAGDPPPAPPSTGTGANPGGTPGGTPSNGNGMTIAELESLLLRVPDCKKNPDDVKDLAESLKGKYGIVSCTTEVDGLQQIVLVPKSDAVPGQQLKYGNVQGLKLLRARFFDHYLVLVFDKQIQYLDLLKTDKDAEGKEGGFSVAGFIAEKNASKFVDAGAFVDALRNYMNLTGEDAGAIAEVPKRVTQVLGSKAYNLAGTMAGSPKPVFVVTAVSGGLVYNLWPTIIMPGNDTVPKPNPYTDLVGPSNAMGGDISSENKKFDASFETSEKRKAVLIGTQQAAEENDIALYVTEDPIKKDTDAEKKYYLMFRYRSPDPKDVGIFRHKQIEVFNKDNPYPGDGLKMSGLVKAGSVVASRGAAGYKFVSGSKKEKGVFALFQNKQVSATNAQQGAANCAGPLIWWGLDREAALKVCQDDKF